MRLWPHSVWPPQFGLRCAMGELETVDSGRDAECPSVAFDGLHAGKEALMSLMVNVSQRRTLSKARHAGPPGGGCSPASLSRPSLDMPSLIKSFPCPSSLCVCLTPCPPQSFKFALLIPQLINLANRILQCKRPTCSFVKPPPASAKEVRILLHCRPVT